MKYVVVSNFPDDECLEKTQHLEYNTYKEAVSALLDCVERASLSTEILLEAELPEMEEDEDEKIISFPQRKEKHKFFNGAVMEYFIGDRVYSLYQVNGPKISA